MNEIDHCLKEKNKKVIGLTKDKLDSKIIKEFAALIAKTYSYSTNNNDEDTNTKGTKKCVAKSKLKFEN